MFVLPAQVLKTKVPTKTVSGVYTVDPSGLGLTEVLFHTLSGQTICQGGPQTIDVPSCVMVVFGVTLNALKTIILSVKEVSIKRLLLFGSCKSGKQLSKLPKKQHKVIRINNFYKCCSKFGESYTAQYHS